MMRRAQSLGTTRKNRVDREEDVSGKPSGCVACGSVYAKRVISYFTISDISEPPFLDGWHRSRPYLTL